MQMWEQQNLYIIRGLRMYGYDKEADELKAVSLKVVRDYYEKWGTVFEYYDAVDKTDPTQTLRKPHTLYVQMDKLVSLLSLVDKH